MKKIFLIMALLVVSSSFLVGCAREDAIAGEAIRIGGLTVGELEAKLDKKLSVQEITAELDKGTLSAKKIMTSIELASLENVKTVLDGISAEELTSVMKLGRIAEEVAIDRGIAIPQLEVQKKWP
ncbi:hypothetical protein GOV03_00620 [Candidatus Woesearchaeota archaeon]|nr:hypothetical protein [Candidatus Woesearchaeota archaeon]